MNHEVGKVKPREKIAERGRGEERRRGEGEEGRRERGGGRRIGEIRIHFGSRRSTVSVRAHVSAARYGLSHAVAMRFVDNDVDNDGKINAVEYKIHVSGTARAPRVARRAVRPGGFAAPMRIRAPPALATCGRGARRDGRHRRGAREWEVHRCPHIRRV